LTLDYSELFANQKPRVPRYEKQIRFHTNVYNNEVAPFFFDEEDIKKFGAFIMRNGEISPSAVAKVLLWIIRKLKEDYGISNIKELLAKVEGARKKK